MSIFRRFDHHYPSLITTNTGRRRPILASSTSAELFLKVMAEVELEEQFVFNAYVIMPDHTHWVLSLPDGKSSGRIVELVKGRFAWRYNRLARRTGRLWQTRYHEQALLNDEEFHKAIAYVHNNPVVAGLVDEDHLYRWSSAASQRIHGVRSRLDPVDAQEFFRLAPPIPTVSLRG